MFQIFAVPSRYTRKYYVSLYAMFLSRLALGKMARFFVFNILHRRTFLASREQLVDRGWTECLISTIQGAGFATQLSLSDSGAYYIQAVDN